MPDVNMALFVAASLAVIVAPGLDNIYAPAVWIAVPVPDSGIPREVVDAAREQVVGNRAPSRVGNRSWELSGGIGRCAACGWALRGRKRTKKSGERRYDYFYYRCSRNDQHGAGGCENTRFANPRVASTASSPP